MRALLSLLLGRPLRLALPTAGVAADDVLEEIDCIFSSSNRDSFYSKDRFLSAIMFLTDFFSLEPILSGCRGTALSVFYANKVLRVDALWIRLAPTPPPRSRFTLPFYEFLPDPKS